MKKLKTAEEGVKSANSTRQERKQEFRRLKFLNIPKHNS